MIRRSPRASARGPSPEVRGSGLEELPVSKERWLCCHRRAERCYSTFKVRRGGGEELSLVQGKEQWLRRRRRAKRTYSNFKVRRGDLVKGKEQSSCALLEQQ